MSVTSPLDLGGLAFGLPVGPGLGDCRSAGGAVTTNDLIATGDASDIAVIAEEQNVSEKIVRSTLSLAFLASDIVYAAIDCRLPRGLGVSQVTGLPTDWTPQRQQLGLG